LVSSKKYVGANPKKARKSELAKPFATYILDPAGMLDDASPTYELSGVAETLPLN
jgi:hypothetical protein